MVEVFDKKPREMILELFDKKKSYLSKLALKTGTTFSYSVRILQGLEDLGLIKRTKKGRINILQLTSKGVRIAIRLKEVNEIMEDGN